jgi:hypothetical protein
MELEIVSFMREHPDWEYLLSEEPYCLKTIWDGNYCLIKYNQLASDFSIKIVRECRGIIFYAEEDGTMTPVCVPFFKFGNYGETYADEIDWTSARVQEKIDGSLIKVWWHKGWHISTNGCINAAKASTAVDGVSYKDKVIEAFEKLASLEEIAETLHPDYTYMFELVSPETRVVIPYNETKLYYLGCRSNLTFEEDWAKGCGDCCGKLNMARPRFYSLFSLNDCVRYVQDMTQDEEGFVVVDANWHRIKIKSPEYLIAHKVRNNNIITLKNVVTMIMDDTIDDFLAYANDIQQVFAKEIARTYIYAQKEMDVYWKHYGLPLFKQDLTKFEFFEKVKDFPAHLRDYLCAAFDEKASDPAEFLKHKTRPYIIKMIQFYFGNREGTNNE